MFYNLYDGKSRKEFEGELIEHFGSLVKMPLLKPDRDRLPDSVKSILEEGLNLYQLHQRRHGRAEPTKGSYAKDWAKWEKQLREVLFSNADYLNSIQVPFEFAVEKVLEQLRTIAKGDYSTPSTEKRKFGNIVYVAVSLTVGEIRSLLDNVYLCHGLATSFWARLVGIYSSAAVMLLLLLRCCGDAAVMVIVMMKCCGVVVGCLLVLLMFGRVQDFLSNL